MWSLCAFLHGIKWIMFQGHLDYFHKTPLGGRPNTKTRRPWHSERSHLLIYYILSCMKTLLEYKFIKPTFGWGLGHIWLHTTLEGPWPQYTILEVSRPPLGGRPNTKLGDHGTLNAHNCRSIIFYYAWGPHLNKNSSNQHLVEGLITYDFTLPLRAGDHTTWFWTCLGDGLWTLLLGSHNFMIMAIGSCVKWP